jgi:hypothetical protein
MIEVEKSQELERLHEKIDSILTLLQFPQQPDLKELYAALALAQAEYKIAKPTHENNYFKMKYEALEDVVRASRPYLAKNGLSVTWKQSILPDSGSVLTCTLAHSSGQQIESSVRILPGKNDPRSFFSETEYLKRMLYSGLTGVVADDDDDGEMAMHEFRDTEEKGVALTTKYNPKENLRVTITPEQLEELNYELAEFPDLADQVLHQLNLRYLADMPKEKFRIAMERIRKIKLLRNGKE